LDVKSFAGFCAEEEVAVGRFGLTRRDCAKLLIVNKIRIKTKKLRINLKNEIITLQANTVEERKLTGMKRIKEIKEQFILFLNPVYPLHPCKFSPVFIYS